MGANNGEYQLTEGETAFIRKAYDECSAFLSICGGIFSMYKAGLLEGKKVSCPRPILEVARKHMLGTNWIDKRWSRDGKIWSSGTLLNGTDLIRGFAEETWGGRSGMIEAMLDAGAYPTRDIDYKDFHGHNFVVPAN